MEESGAEDIKVRPEKERESVGEGRKIRLYY